MSSRDLVRDTLEFAIPARVPRQMWLLSWASEHHREWVQEIQSVFPDDVVTCPVTYRTPLRSGGDRFAGKITFWGEIDRQHVLPHGTTEDVYDAVRTARRWLYRDGGVIAQCEFGPGAKPENVYSVFKAWDEL